jgi:ABC-2 type transport system ATP-binding protein
MPGAISVRGLEKRFGEVNAVRGVDLEVESGTVLALLGPNGAGKTTTVEILEGFLQPDAGEVRVLGLDPRTERRKMLERVGIVLQECAVEQFLSVRESLDRRSRHYPHPRDIAEVIAAIGLQEKADARVRTLSGGQQRRLDLGLGLIGDPEVLFLDEPTTGFDPTARREAWEVVHQLASEGRTVLLTTHYMDEADKLCDRIAIVDHGKLIALDSPMRLKAAVSGISTVEVSFAGPPADWRGRLEGLAGVDSVTGEGSQFRLTSHAGAATTGAVLAEAADRGVTVESISVANTTLDDVFLHYTGRQLRDQLEGPSAADSPFIMRR